MNNLDSTSSSELVSNSKIVFGDVGNNKERPIFSTDHLPKVDSYNNVRILQAYLQAFELGIDNKDKGLESILKILHLDALGGVNWKNIVYDFEGAELALNTNYSSGQFRNELPTRLSFAYGAKGVVYDAPMPEKAIKIINTLDDFLNIQANRLERVSDDYFDLAAMTSIVTFLAHPFLGGNKRVIRPLITNILARGGLTGRWLEGDQGFIESFKETWSNMVLDFQSYIGGENADDIPNYDVRWLEYWQHKIKSGEILKDINIKNFANKIKTAPIYLESMSRKIAIAQ